MMVLSRKITSSFQKFKRHLQNPLRLDRPEPFFDGPVFLQRSSDRRTGNGVWERICDEDIGTGVSYVKCFLSSKKKPEANDTQRFWLFLFLPFISDQKGPGTQRLPVRKRSYRSRKTNRPVLFVDFSGITHFNKFRIKMFYRSSLIAEIQ